MTSPWTFLFHTGKELLVNGVDIYHHIVSARTNWDNKAYLSFGEDIGDIIADLTTV